VGAEVHPEAAANAPQLSTNHDEEISQEWRGYTPSSRTYRNQDYSKDNSSSETIPDVIVARADFAPC